MARSDSVTSSHTLFGFTVVIISLSRSYNNQVKNAVAWEEKNRRHLIKRVSARRFNFGHSSTLYIVFSSLIFKKVTLP